MYINNAATICRRERNLLEAISAGAGASIKLVANIAVNLIAFLALLAFLNAVVAYAGELVGHEGISFQVRRIALSGIVQCSWVSS